MSLDNTDLTTATQTDASMQQDVANIQNALFDLDISDSPSAHETKCLMPFCQNIKYRMKQKQLQARLATAQLLRRGMAIKDTSIGSQPGPSPQQSPVPEQQQNVPQSLQHMMNQPQDPQMETDFPVPFYQNIKYKIKQQQLQARLHQAQLLRRPVMNTTRGSQPGPSPQQSPVPEQQQKVPQSLQHMMNQHQDPQMETKCLVSFSRIIQCKKKRLQQAQLPQRPMAVVNTTRGSQPEPNPQSKQALQQLLATFRSPNTPEQQQQILQILKSNPQLMAALIKQRQIFQQMQQQQQQQQSPQFPDDYTRQ